MLVFNPDYDSTGSRYLIGQFERENILVISRRHVTAAAARFLTEEWDRGDVMISEQVMFPPESQLEADVLSRCLQLYEHAEASEGTIDARRLITTAELALGLLLCPQVTHGGLTGSPRGSSRGCRLPW